MNGKESDIVVEERLNSGNSSLKFQRIIEGMMMQWQF
jgi:hypothetical protein